MGSEDRERIVRAVHALRQDPFAHDIAPLRGRSGWRLRVGGWRVLLHVDKAARVIMAMEIGPRGDVYK
jgi:mRNA interferase RelE/StbE